MEPVSSAWDYFSKIPALLNQYGDYSKPLLTVLLALGLLGLAALLAIWFKNKQPPSAAYLALFGGIAFLSVAGFYLKEMGRREQAEVFAKFIAQNRFNSGQYGIVVFDFNVPPEADAMRRTRLLGHMPLLVHTVSEVLRDDLPSEFALPNVVHVSAAGSPWEAGVTQQNFKEVITQFNALEIMWGAIYSAQSKDMAKVSLGMRANSQRQLDEVIPLHDLLLEEDPRAEHQFGDGRFQLLGAVTLGIALQTYDDAQRAQGDERKRLFLRAVQQITRAREALNNRSNDPALRRTLYSAQVSDLLSSALREAGVQL